MKKSDIFKYLHYRKLTKSKFQEEESLLAVQASKAKFESSKREQKNEESVKRQKRPLEDDVKQECSGILNLTKKRKCIIPEDNSEDSQYKYEYGIREDKVENDVTISLAKAIRKNKQPTPETDKDDNPQKKQKLNNGKSKRKSSAQKNSDGQLFGEAFDTQSWPHLKYDFLQSDNIKDKEKHPADHPDYDPKTIHVPYDFLQKQTPIMRQWWILKSDNYDTVLFFKVGAFYELYHMDADIGNKELGLAYMKRQIACSGFSEKDDFLYSKHSAYLIEKGYKVARIEQTENEEMKNERLKKMSKPTKFDKVIKREICQISSRGTRVCTSYDAEVFESTSTYLLSIIEKRTYGQSTSTYGVCFIDTTIGNFNLGQFQNDKCSSRLLTLLTHYPPSHIVYERGNLTSSTMKMLDNYCHGSIKDALHKETQFWSSSKVLKFLIEAEYFQTEENSNFTWPKGLKPYLNKADSLGLIADEEKELAVNALGGCVYLLKTYRLDQWLLPQGRFKTYTPPDLTGEATNNRKLADNMVLDPITIHNLRVLGNDNSLIKTLDHCGTAFGKRLLREWICRPSCRKDVIVERQEATSELLDNPDIAKKVHCKLVNLPDLERLLSKIQGNAIKLSNHPDERAIIDAKVAYIKRTIDDFIVTLKGFEELLKIIQQFAKFKNPLINKCTQLEPQGDFPDLQKILDYFKNAFDQDEVMREGYIVPQPGDDSDYDAVLLELKEIETELKAYLDKQRQYFGGDVKYAGSDKKRFQIEVPESLTEKAGSGYELVSSTKKSKKYYTAETKDLLARQLAAEKQKDKILKESYRKIFAKFAEHYDKWSKAVHNIAIIDCLLSLTEYAQNCDTCIPRIHGDDTDEKGIFIEIKDGKHPCIVTENFIPNDTVIASSAPLIILTGPNMGGKSTLMRQVGLITIMAHIGCQVPASDCELSLVDRIFTRLGASDDIVAGQSTFMVELSETAAVLHHATKFSLVILDELGRGTSTYDGTAIAASVVEALMKVRCRTLFSTHYYSLIEDYKTNNNVAFAHMACMVENENEDEVCKEKVKFLYKLSKGPFLKSHGFSTAQLAGMPHYITERAREMATKFEVEINLRHTFTALCRLEDGSLKDLIENTRNLLSKI